MSNKRLDCASLVCLNSSGTDNLTASGLVSFGLARLVMLLAGSVIDHIPFY
jgi:hypothetical protein